MRRLELSLPPNKAPLGKRKKILSYFIFLVFCFFITGPGIVKILNHDADISFIYTVAEEENKQEKGKDKDLKNVFIEGSPTYAIISPKIRSLNAGTYYKDFKPTSGIEVPLPPPKHII